MFYQQALSLITKVEAYLVFSPYIDIEQCRSSYLSHSVTDCRRSQRHQPSTSMHRRVHNCGLPCYTRLQILPLWIFSVHMNTWTFTFTDTLQWKHSACACSQYQVFPSLLEGLGTSLIFYPNQGPWVWGYWVCWQFSLSEWLASEVKGLLSWAKGRK